MKPELVPVTPDAAYTQVAQLVQKFKDLPAARRRDYNEAATRLAFILPLFAALGWNITDTAEVSPEEKTSRGWVDFSFRLSGIPRFFLETKKIAADLTDQRWVRQAIDYAWTKSVTWALLSDFEGLRVFNAEWKEDNPLRAQFIEFSVDTYLTDFPRLWWLSRPEIAAGTLDREAEKVGKKVHKEPVSQHLFDDLKAWRHELFRTLRFYNKRYSLAQIDEAVLRILNRLIFIRTAEDRLVEERCLLPLLHDLEKRGRINDLRQELATLFREFDSTYDSDLFAAHFSEDLDGEPEPFRILIEGLYEKRGGYVRYNFNAIDADVLGTAYEQYLGYVVAEPGRGEPGARPEVVEKRAKRKAQGIYYTPTFVVKYIVQQTLGRYLEEQGYQPSRPVRVLDMACGSGSFLIEAFDVLDRYLARQRGQASPPAPLLKGEGSIPRLAYEDIHDYARRMEILAQNIYGVDKDEQAVAVARLNLLLKALHTRDKLPMLENIRCGDSLISGTAEELQAAFGKDWQAKKPFNWEKEFPKVMKDGGFDVIVGNPPYVSFGLRGAEKKDEQFDAFVRTRYPNSAEYKLSTYALFMNRAMDLLRDGGLLGFIVPDSFLLGRYFSKLRRYILDTCVIQEIVMFTEDFWQSGTIGRPVVIVLQKVHDPSVRLSHVTTVRLCDGLEQMGMGKFVVENAYEQSYFESVPYNRFRLFFTSEAKQLVEKLESVGVRAEEIVSIHTGVRSKIGQANIVSNRSKGKNWQRGLISGSEVHRYLVEWAGNYLNISPNLLFAGGWDEAIIRQLKLFLRQTGDSLICGLDEEGLYHLNNVHSIISKDRIHSLKYIMALLNSRLLNAFYHLITLELGRVMAQTDIETVEKLPIRRINFADPADRQRHDAIVALVTEMLQLQKDYAQAEREKEDRRHVLKRRIAEVDAAIDRLVYELYGLTEEEIAVVEGTTTKTQP